MTFTSGNWNIAQTVTVTGVDDFGVDGAVAYTIVTATATSTDPDYSGRNAADVSVPFGPSPVPFSYVPTQNCP